MSCKDYQFGDLFNNTGISEERTLAEKYILSVQCQEEPGISDAKYWDYFNHINELRSFDEKLHGLMMKIHEEEREKWMK